MNDNTQDPKSQDKTIVGFFPITNELWRCRMKHRAKEVFGVIGSFAGAIPGGQCWATTETIARMACSTEKTVGKAIKLLASNCFNGNPLISLERRGKAHSFLITIHKSYLDSLRFSLGKIDFTKLSNLSSLGKKDPRRSVKKTPKEELTKNNPSSSLPPPSEVGVGRRGRGEEVTQRQILIDRLVEGTNGHLPKAKALKLLKDMPRGQETSLVESVLGRWPKAHPEKIKTPYEFLSIQLEEIKTFKEEGYD